MKQNSQTMESQTPAIMVRGMRGMSSMGKPVSSRPTDTRNQQQVTTSTKKPTVNEFTCSCAPGWTGPTCAISKYTPFSRFFFL